MNMGFIDNIIETLAVEEHERRRKLVEKLKISKCLYYNFQEGTDKDFTSMRTSINRSVYNKGLHRMMLSRIANYLRFLIDSADEQKREYLRTLEDFGTNHFIPLKPWAKRSKYLLFLRRYLIYER